MGIAWGLNNTVFRPSSEGRWTYLLYDTDAGFGFGGSIYDNYIESARYPGFPSVHELFDHVLNNALPAAVHQSVCGPRQYHFSAVGSFRRDQHCS